MSYEFFRWVHILSNLILLGAFVGSLAYGFWVYRAKSISIRYNFIRTERQITKWGITTGVGGILISGWVLSMIPQGPQWGWFKIQLYPWLTLKQMLFVIILMLIIIDLRKSQKLTKWMQKNKTAGRVEGIKKWIAAYRYSIAVYILIVLSALLGWYKPGLTTFG